VKAASYDPTSVQQLTRNGTVTPPGGWAPDACQDSGHVALSGVSTAGKSVRIECGRDPAHILSPWTSSSLFTNFSSGVKGTAGTAGRPGWGVLQPTGSGRSGLGMCGQNTGVAAGGIGYCDGSVTSFLSGLASYSTGATGAGDPLVECGGTGCSGPGCDLQVWVWLQ
jgi:hypothetical protein